MQRSTNLIIKRTSPIKSPRLFKTPQGAIPTVTIFARPTFEEGITVSRAAATCLTTPASIPEVNIQASKKFIKLRVTNVKERD